jgi:hypothetical protein
VGYILWLGFFRHDSAARPAPPAAGFAVVFGAAVIAMILINKTVF